MKTPKTIAEKKIGKLKKATATNHWPDVELVDYCTVKDAKQAIIKAIEEDRRQRK